MTKEAVKCIVIYKFIHQILNWFVHIYFNNNKKAQSNAQYGKKSWQRNAFILHKNQINTFI